MQCSLNLNKLYVRKQGLELWDIIIMDSTFSGVTYVWITVEKRESNEQYSQ